MTSLVLWTLAGLALLVLGAEGLVRGASRLATAWGVSPLVVGLTVVAAGTSMPELIVSVSAALDGKADLSLGNVVGSNIFNIMVILGLSAIARPLDIQMQYIRKETPLMIGATLLLGAAAWGGEIGRLEGVAGVLLFVAYTYYGYKASRAEKKEVQQEFAEYAAHASAGAASVPANLLLIAGGVAALGLGADWLIDGASGIARAAGVSERAIGLTLVAAGTSLPELATSVLAAIRGERDIAVANVIGSNVYNVLLILGVTGAISPLPASETILLHDFPWALGSAMVLIPFFMTGRRLDRLEGALLLLGYGVYVALLASGAAA